MNVAIELKFGLKNFWVKFQHFWLKQFTNKKTPIHEKFSYFFPQILIFKRNLENELSRFVPNLSTNRCFLFAYRLNEALKGFITFFLLEHIFHSHEFTLKFELI